MNNNLVTKKYLKFKPATIEDSDILLRWRNDSETRRSSFNSQKISVKKHIEWLKNSIKDANRKIFIVFYNKIPVGTIRTDCINDSCLLSWTVAPEARGRGVGKEMVASFVGQIKNSICAEIKTDNQASINIAKYAGLTIDHEKKGIIYFQRPAVPVTKNKLK